LGSTSPSEIRRHLHRLGALGEPKMGGTFIPSKTECVQLISPLDIHNAPPPHQQ
jgi:hypothetical protein